MSYVALVIFIQFLQNKKRERVHSEYKKVDIAHVYWRIQYDTFEVSTCTADLFVFLYW